MIGKPREFQRPPARREPSPSKAVDAYLAFTMRQDVITTRTHPVRVDTPALQLRGHLSQYAQCPVGLPRRMRAAALLASRAPLRGRLRTVKRPLQTREPVEEGDRIHRVRNDLPYGGAGAALEQYPPNVEDGRSISPGFEQVVRRRETASLFQPYVTACGDPYDRDREATHTRTARACQSAPVQHMFRGRSLYSGLVFEMLSPPVCAWHASLRQMAPASRRRPSRLSQLSATTVSQDVVVDSARRRP